MSLGVKGNSLLRRRASARLPWKKPQSSRILVRPAWTRCIEPVTVRAAPQNVTLGDDIGCAFFAMAGDLRVQFPISSSYAYDRLNGKPLRARAHDSRQRRDRLAHCISADSR